MSCNRSWLHRSTARLFDVVMVLYLDVDLVLKRHINVVKGVLQLWGIAWSYH